MIEQKLKQVFGFDSLRNGQKQVIDNVLSGHSTAAIFPTGSGKSLCYQLPALELPHLTLVISPLLALMKDQLSFLHSKGISAAAIESSQDRQTTQQVMQSVRNGDTKILMISVERLKTNAFASSFLRFQSHYLWSMRRTVFLSGDTILDQIISSFLNTKNS